MDIKNTYDNEATIYEQTSRQVNIHYDEALSAMINLMPKCASNILDVFSGTGILTELVYKKYPNAKISCVDFSSGMLEVAKQRFVGDVSFYNCDLLDRRTLSSIKDRFDLVVSSFGIHNIHTKNKKLEAMKNIADLMESGALYINCDYIKGANKQEEISFYETRSNHLMKSFDEKETKEWIKLLDEEDDQETWLDNKDILETAGFKNIKLLWQKDYIAIWSAVKE